MTHNVINQFYYPHFYRQLDRCHYELKELLIQNLSICVQCNKKRQHTILGCKEV